MEKSNKKSKKIVLIVLVLLLAVLAVLAYWQRNNIQAVKDFASYSQTELEEKLQENDQKIKDAVNAAPEITVRDVTEEERQALREGALTQEELADRLLGESEVVENSAKEQESKPVSETAEKTENTTVPEKPAQAPQSSKQPTTEESADSEYQKKISALIAKVYVLREEYIIALDNLQHEAESEYKAQRKAGVAKSELTGLVSGYLARGNALEKECDRRMDTIVVSLEKLIRENNGDMSIVDTVISTYSSEKSLKKAWYMSELQRRISD